MQILLYAADLVIKWGSLIQFFIFSLWMIKSPQYVFNTWIMATRVVVRNNRGGSYAFSVDPEFVNYVL